MIALTITYILLAPFMGASVAFMSNELVPKLPRRPLLVFCIVFWLLAWVLLFAAVLVSLVVLAVLEIIDIIKKLWG